MAYDASAAGRFSGRPDFDLYIYVRRGQTDVANNRATYAFAVYARKHTPYASWDLTGRTVYISVGGHYVEAHGIILDFRNTDTIGLYGGETGWIQHDGNGFLNLAFGTEMVGAGIFGNAAASGVLSADRIPQPPDPPSTPTLVRATGDRLDFSFSAGNNGGSAILDFYMQLSRNSDFTQIVQTRTSKSTSQSFSGLDPATNYYLRVRARNAVGNSGWSNWRRGTTAVEKPNAPAGLAISNLAPTSATLTWNAPTYTGGDAVDGYTIQRATNADFTQSVVTYTQGTSRSRAFADLLPSTTYYFRVAARNSAGTGSYSSRVQATTVSGAYYSTSTAWQAGGVFGSNGSSWSAGEIFVSDGTDWIAAI